MESHQPSFRWVIVAAVIVFAIAVALRMPSCYESFWLDELHSAWTVWGDLPDVAPRARAGHQTPLYFFGLWFWKQILGDSELVLRMSSVIATSMACFVLTIGVARWSKSVMAGVTSGLILAIESNSIFFGTELRPYAFVLLFATIVQLYFLNLFDSKSRFENPRLWSILIITILLATLIQPTAIGVLSLFPIVLIGHWAMGDRRELTRIGMLDALLLVSAATTAFALWRTTLGESWQNRSQWATFGSATEIKQIVEVWDWLWLLIVPLGLTGIAAIVSKRFRTRMPEQGLLLTVLWLSFIATVGTCVYWLTSWLEWAPIWHRRYFVAVLPAFAAIGGGAVGAVHQMAAAHRPARRLVVVSAGLLLVGLGLQQGTLQALPNYPVALAVRGEDWRGAIRWVSERIGDQDQLHLEAGLIEANDLLSVESRPSPGTGATVTVVRPPPPDMAEYLRFPVSGPYKVDRPVGLYDAEHDVFMPSHRPYSIFPSASKASRQWIIVRGRPKRFMNMRRGLGTVVPFGGVSVIIKPGELDGRF